MSMKARFHRHFFMNAVVTCATEVAAAVLVYFPIDKLALMGSRVRTAALLYLSIIRDKYNNFFVWNPNNPIKKVLRMYDV